METPLYHFEQFMEPDFPICTSDPPYKKLFVHSHFHKAAELNMITSGQAQVIVGSKQFHCRKGDIIFIPPYTVHQIISITEDVRLRGIIFEFSIIEAAHISIDYEKLFTRYLKLHPIILPMHPCYKQLKEYIEIILKTYDEPSAYQKMQLLSYLLLTTSCLMQHYSLLDNMTSKRYSRLLPVLQYVEEHYAEKIQLSELSNLIYICDDQLIRLFKEVTGEPPIRYIMNLRIEAAMRLLASTDLSTAAIAEQTGFGSANYLNRVFKQKLHMSPLVYRKRK